MAIAAPVRAIDTRKGPCSELLDPLAAAPATSIKAFVIAFGQNLRSMRGVRPFIGAALFWLQAVNKRSILVPVDRHSNDNGECSWSPCFKVAVMPSRTTISFKLCVPASAP
jgi:hypothetical protein